MPSSNGSPSRSASESAPNRRSKSKKKSKKKSYNAPQIALLKPDQAEADLKVRGLPGDPGVQQLLNLIAELDKGAKEDGPA